MQIRDEAKGISFPALVLYPTEVPSATTAFGPYTMDVSPDSPVAEGRFPVVVISHEKFHERLPAELLDYLDEKLKGA